MLFGRSFCEEKIIGITHLSTCTTEINNLVIFIIYIMKLTQKSKIVIFYLVIYI